MVREDKSTWKANYFIKLTTLLDEYPKCFIVGADNVGSKQMQEIRIALRGKAIVLMGKNTMMRKAIRGHLEKNPDLERLLPFIKMNVGFVFTKEDLIEVRDMLLANKVRAPAKAGVTIDSDIHYTETIGQHTGVEQGAEKLRRYVADAYTHQRCYIIEMMGAEGGFHALESCVGAGAHYAALTETLPEKELIRVAEAISTRRSTVIAVSEGYARELRKSWKAQAKTWSNFIPFVSTSSRPGHKDLVSASSFLKWQLLKTGRLDPRKKVVCEPFSRDIRGAAPNNLDTFLSQQMAAKVVEMDQSGINRVMPAVLSGKVSYIPFDRIRTYNGVKAEVLALADHL